MAGRNFREIQVSSSQLVLIFLALLAVAVVIFLLGVSVGKRSAETSQLETSSLNISPALPRAEEAAPALTPEKKEETKVMAEKTTAAAETSKEQPPLAKVTASTKQPEAASPKLETTTISKPVQTTLKPSAKSEAQKKLSPAAGNYFVQAGAFSTKEAAATLVQKLTNLGYQTQVLEPFPTDRNPVYRVRVGPFSNLQEAEKVRDHIRSSVREAAKAFIVRS